MANKMRSSNPIYWVTALTIILIVGAGILLYQNATGGAKHKFLLPSKFTGWVVVTYEQAGSPALKEEDGAFIYEVPPSGKVATSSKSRTGPMAFYYVDQEGQLTEVPNNVPMIHSVGTSSGGNDDSRVPERLTFFVGTEEQWKNEVDNKSNP